MTTRRLALFAALLTVALTGCGGGETTDARPPGGAVTGDVTVLAAASLTESFTRIGEDFEAANPGVRVTFSFAGSSALANQINQGAPADVFASASPANMTTVIDAGNGDGNPRVFVRNQLVIAVPDGNPGGVNGLADLAQPGVKVALCAEQSPVARRQRGPGRRRDETHPGHAGTGRQGGPVQGTAGEVDTALVYRSDVRAADDDVDGIEFPESAGAVNDYPIVVLRNAPNQPAALAFVEHVLSGPGQAVLAAAGFQAP